MGKLPYAAALGWTPTANRPLTSYLLSTSGLTFLPFVASGANCFFLTCPSQGKWFLKGTATPSSGRLFRAAIPPMQHTQAHGLQGSPAYGSSTSGFQRRQQWVWLSHEWLTEFLCNIIWRVSVGEEVGNLLGPLYFALQCGIRLDCWTLSVMHSAIKHLSGRKSFREKLISLHLCAINGWHFYYGGAIYSQSGKNLESSKLASDIEQWTGNQKPFVLIPALLAMWLQENSIFSGPLFTQYHPHRVAQMHYKWVKAHGKLDSFCWCSCYDTSMYRIRGSEQWTLHFS